MSTTFRLASATRWITVALAATLLAACGGGGGGDNRACSDDPNRDPRLPSCTSTVSASSLQLLVATQQIATDTLAPVTVTAVVLDANRVGMPNQPVTMSLSDPAGTAFLSDFVPSTLSGNAHVTDANGRVTATINPGATKSNRTITVQANAGGTSASNTVAVVGTTLRVAGANAISLGSSARLTVTAADSANVPIPGATVSVSSALGNTVSPGSATTDSSGQAFVTVTGTKAGNDTITASGLGATAAFALSVSSDSFTFTTPAPGTVPQVAVNAQQLLVVRWTNNGAPVAGATISFASTRGTVVPAQVATSATGEAVARISSTSPGPAIVTASPANSSAIGASANVQFVITNTPASLDLQADRTTVPVNAAGSNANAVNLVAVVRDTSDNLVPGAKVNFRIDSDVTGGSLAPPSAVTDVNGTARAQYVPTTVSSPTNGVVIRATLLDAFGNGIATKTIALTVGGQKLFVRIGTDNLLELVDANYVRKYSAFVTDAGGNPVPNATVQFVLRPRQDVKFDPNRTGDAGYVTQFQQRNTSPPAGIPPSFDFAYYKGFSRWNGAIWEAVITASCFNEDVNFNGILDPGEDYNSNGRLNPGNVFSVPQTLTTNSSGYATATITYPKQFARWTVATLVATAFVSGTEANDTATFTLPIALRDVSEEFGSPPGRISPFGQSDNCKDPN